MRSCMSRLKASILIRRTFLSGEALLLLCFRHVHETPYTLFVFCRAKGCHFLYSSAVFGVIGQQCLSYPTEAGDESSHPHQDESPVPYVRLWSKEPGYRKEKERDRRNGSSTTPSLQGQQGTRRRKISAIGSNDLAIYRV